MADKADAAWRPAVARPLDVDRFHPVSAEIVVDVAAASVCGTGRDHNTDHYLALRIGRNGFPLLGACFARERHLSRLLQNANALEHAEPRIDID